MAHLTYSKTFQQAVIRAKQSGSTVEEITNKFGISKYSLYKILWLNDAMPIPSQASAGNVPEEGVEHRNLSPNNNDSHERPASLWPYKSDRHKKVRFICLNCNSEFFARNRKGRVKFCSRACRGKYRTRANSSEKTCLLCGDKFLVKNSARSKYIHCKACRKTAPRYPTSQAATKLGDILEGMGFVVERERSFSWFFDKKKPKGRYRLDFFLPDHNIAVEYDGEQHFKPCFTSDVRDVQKTRQRDLTKDKLCREHGVIRFSYDMDITEELVKMKIYAELQGNEPVEHEDKKPHG